MHMKNGNKRFRAVFVGSGPAGSGPLVCALQHGRLEVLLDAGVAMLDSSDSMCRGTLGKYVINSDTLSDTFLECLKGHENGVLARAAQAPSRHALAAFAGGPAPLALAGEFMGELGAALQAALDAHPISQFFPRTTATEVRMLDGGGFEVLAETMTASGKHESIKLEAENVVLATGGVQSRRRVLQASVAGRIPLAPDYEDKVVLSDVALTPAGVDEVRSRLQASGHRTVVIIGGSHSATSSAWTLLNKSGIVFGEGDITILHREKLKLFYPSRETALAEGYTDFTDDDLCPRTGRVYRLAGFRFDSRELLMRIWGMGDRAPEKRVKLMQLAADGSDACEVRRLLDDAGVIITALGYRPASIAMCDPHGREVRLCANGDGAPPLVDRQCRVLDAAGAAIPNLYGIGLASGFVPSGELGGEPSFRGQTNGLWLYQNGVGEIVLNALLR
jgi:hypothetical protein